MGHLLCVTCCSGDRVQDTTAVLATVSTRNVCYKGGVLQVISKVCEVSHQPL
jgi:hypothetical protein